MILRKQTGKRFSVEKIIDLLERSLSKKNVEFSIRYAPRADAKLLDVILNSIWILQFYFQKHTHIFGDITYLSNFLPVKKFSVTILDFNERTNSNSMKDRLYRFLWIKRPAQRARSVHVLSAFIAKQLMQSVKSITDKNISVIPPLISKPEINEKNNFSLKENFFLVVGTKANKNLLDIFEAAHLANIKLVIIGTKSEESMDFAIERQINFEWMEFVDNLDLEFLYQKSKALIFVSRYEGFGVPPVEAIFSGTLAICSNIDPLKEILGEDDPLMVELGNVNELVKKIVEVASFSKAEYLDRLKAQRKPLKKLNPLKVEKLYEEFFENF